MSSLEGVKPLTRRLAAEIMGHLEESGAAPGAHLNANTLAEAFSVSRFPIREALRALEKSGVLIYRPRRGYFFSRLPDSKRQSESVLEYIEDHALAARIIHEHLHGRLAQEFTESDLVRHFALTRSDVRDAVDRLAREGWIERRMGYGWIFLSFLTSPEALQQSYRLRMAIEPAALLEPSFKVNRVEFDRWRGVMRDLRHEPDRFSNAQIFKLGSRFHEMLIGCAHNPFFLETLKRQNRLRQMIELRVPSADRERTVLQVDEHLELMDRMQDGDIVGAATLMRRHLDVVGARKVRSIASAESQPAGAPECC